MSKNEELIRQIGKLETKLRELKIKLQQEESKPNEQGFKVGDFVTINNPSKGQESKGSVVKVNRTTGYVTVRTPKTGNKVVRLEKNLSKTTQG